MVKRIIALILIPVACYAGVFVDGYEQSTVEILDFPGVSTPATSTTNSARLYYNPSSDTLKLSVNAGAYADIGSGGTGDLTWADANTTFVPYTGANDDVDLGNYTLTAGSVSASGTGTNEVGATNFTGDVDIEGGFTFDAATGETVSVNDEAYGTAWNGKTTVPTKNALYDKIESLAGGHDAVTLASDADYLLSLSTQELSLDAATANTVFAGPASGANADPTYRSLVDADIPATFTRDTEWDTASEINAATTDGNFSIIGQDAQFGTVSMSLVSAPTVTLSGTGTINGLDAIDATGESTLEAALDIGGDVVSTGMSSTVIQADAVHDSMIDWGSGANQVDLADIPGGISGSNAWDFGGATDFEVENGANPTVDTAGEISVDTSATSGSMMRFYGDAQYALPAYQTKSFFIENITATDDIALWRTPLAITVRNVHLLVKSGTNVVGQLAECDANGGACVAVDSSDITGTVGTNVNDDGSLSNPSIDSGDYVGWLTTSVSGTVTGTTVSFEYTVDSVN